MRLVGVLGVALSVALYWVSNSSYRFRFLEFMAHIPGRDRTVHFVILFLLCVTTNLGFAGLRVLGKPLGMRLVTLLVILVATLEEYSQQWIPWRSSDPLDLVAGYAGIALAMLLVSPFIPEREAVFENSSD